MKLEEINEKTDGEAFELAFRDGKWSVNEHQILPMLKSLIKQHNKVVNELRNLSISRVDKRGVLLAFLDWHYEDDIADKKQKETIVDVYLNNHT